MESLKVGVITFPHSVHIELFNCTECHSDVFKAEAGASDNRATMKDMEGGKSCGACHNGSTAFSVKGDCGTCHSKAADIPMESPKVGIITFPHSIHIELFNCTKCHSDVFKAEAGASVNRATMKDMEGGKSCGACHDGSTAFSVKGDCATCHSRAVDIVFSLKHRNAGNLAFPHSVHVSTLSWLECKSESFKADGGVNREAMRKMEKGETCGNCHDGAGGFGAVGTCALCHANVADIVFTFKDIGETVFPHSVHIAQFYCTECHPGVFKAEQGANRATMLEMDSGQSCGACHDSNEAFSVKGDCVSCHFLCR
jgi:c(7)-type cytochrome triheme protein